MKRIIKIFLNCGRIFSSTVQNLNASEERNIVNKCYDIIPENVTEEYKFEIKVSTYQL